MDFLTQSFSPPSPPSPASAPSEITAVDAPSSGVGLGGSGDSAATVPTPSIRNGDTKFFSRMHALVTIWPDGTMSKGGTGKETALVEEDWYCEGTLWVTKDKALLFLLDQDSAPRAVPRYTKTSIRRKSLALARQISPTKGKENNVPANNDSAVDDEDEADEGKTGFMGKVKRLFSFGNQDGTNNKDDNNPLSLTRTITGENVFRLARTKTSDYPRRARVAEDDNNATEDAAVAAPATTTDAPAMARTNSSSACPLPTFKGQPITALHVAGATSVLELKYQPYASAKQPAVVQMDVGTPRDKIRLEGFGTAVDQREVTIKFTFNEAMLAKEAEDLKHAVEGFF